MEIIIIVKEVMYLMKIVIDIWESFGIIYSMVYFL